MDTIGKHYIVELTDCNKKLIDNKMRMMDLVRKGIKESNATLMELFFQEFTPQGYSIVGVLAESHISLHYFPEHKYLALDIYTCGDCDPKKCLDYIIEKLEPINVEYMLLKRGVRDIWNKDYFGFTILE